MTLPHCEHHSGIQSEVATNSRNIGRLFDKIDRLHAWVLGIAGGVIASLILLALNLVLNLMQAKGK